MSTSYKNEIVLTQEQLDEAMARARKIRAEAFSAFTSEIGHGVANLYRKLRDAAAKPTGHTVGGAA